MTQAWDRADTRAHTIPTDKSEPIPWWEVKSIAGLAVRTIPPIQKKAATVSPCPHPLFSNIAAKPAVHSVEVAVMTVAVERSIF